MNLDRGTVGGFAPRQSTTRRTPPSSVMGGLLVTIGFLIAVGSLFALLPRQGGTDPDATVSGVTAGLAGADFNATPTAAARLASLLTEVPGTDPQDLPRYPSSIRVAYDDDVAGRVRWTRVEYATDATTELVRAHYRDVFRRYDWFVGEVDVIDTDWRFDANRGSREVTLTITPDDGGTYVTVSLSDLASPATPAPTPAPRATPKPKPPARQTVRAPEQPKTEQPKSEQSKTEQPKSEQPKSEQSKTEQRARTPRQVVTRDDDRREAPRRVTRQGDDDDDDDDDEDDDDDDDD